MTSHRLEKLYDELSVTDALAGMRTELALERTLLAHVRTAFATLVTGVTGTQLSDVLIIKGASYVVIGASVVAFVLGLRRFVRTRDVMLARIEAAAAARR